MKVSFLEIYNEELKDLLVEESQLPLRIYDDTARGTTVQNQEEVIVHGIQDVFNILESASNRRHYAETNMNKNSRYVLQKCCWSFVQPCSLYFHSNYTYEGDYTRG